MQSGNETIGMRSGNETVLECGLGMRLLPPPCQGPMLMTTENHTKFPRQPFRDEGISSIAQWITSSLMYMYI